MMQYKCLAVIKQWFSSRNCLMTSLRTHSLVLEVRRSFTVLVEGSYSGLDTFPAVFAVLVNALASHVDLADCHHLTVSSEITV